MVSIILFENLRSYFCYIIATYLSTVIVPNDGKSCNLFYSKKLFPFLDFGKSRVPFLKHLSWSL